VILVNGKIERQGWKKIEWNYNTGFIHHVLVLKRLLSEF
jgi:hypothetical protein